MKSQKLRFLYAVVLGVLAVPFQCLDAFAAGDALQLDSKNGSIDVIVQTDGALGDVSDKIRALGGAVRFTYRKCAGSCRQHSGRAIWRSGKERGRDDDRERRI